MRRHVPRHRAPHQQTARGIKRFSNGLIQISALVLVVLTGGLGNPPANATVPAPTGNDAVITVKTGGLRTGAATNDVTGTAADVAPLPGVRLGLFATETGATPVAQPWATCNSDADGDCSFTIPDTQVGGANRDLRFWVKQVAAPAGWTVNAQLRTGSPFATPSTTTNYAFRTGLELRAGVTYTSLTNFMRRPGSTTITARDSSGIWQQSLTNPALDQACGLDIALVLDLSGSVAGDLPALKAAADSVIDALTGTPSRVALFSFSSLSPADQGANIPQLRPVATPDQAAGVKSSYANWGSTGGTNWDDALYTVAQAAPRYDAAIVITDGNPTYYGAPIPPTMDTFNRFKDTEYATFSANTLKSEGTRVIAFGVGSAVSGNSALNLAAISGTTAYDGSNAATADYFQVPGYAQASNGLRDLALGQCRGSVTVVKQIVPSGNAPGDVSGATPAPAGWTFNAVSTGLPVGGLPASKQTVDDGTGAVTFPLEVQGIDPVGLNIREEQRAGYQIVPQDGSNAVCVDRSTGQSLGVQNSSTPGNPGFDLTRPSQAAVTCTIYNQRLAPSIELVKKVDKATYQVGDLLTYTLTSTNTGNVALSNVTIDEDTFTGTGQLVDGTCTPQEPAALAPGESITCTATYTATQADVNAGQILNTATTTGTPPTGPNVTDKDNAKTTSTRSPAMTLVKRVGSIEDVNDNGINDAGDLIHYEFDVANTGTVTLADIAVSDPLLSANGITVACDTSKLGPGEKTTCKASVGYIITQADVKNHKVTNVATSTATPPPGTTLPPVPPSSTTTPLGSATPADAQSEGTPGETSAGSQLPNTGGPNGAILVGGLLLTLLGAALVTRSRKRV